MAERDISLRLQVFGADEFQRVLQDAIRGAMASLGGLGSSINRLAAQALALPGPMKVVAAAAAAFGTAFAAGTAAAAEEEIALKRLDAVLKATGSQAGVTTSDVRGMAEALAQGTLATKEEALGAAQALATFGGVGEENFRKVLSLAQDLAAAGFGALRENAQRLGRLFEDPAKAIAALNRELGAFTPALRESIERLARTGDTAGAAELTLETLRKRVGGAGAAERDTLVGAFDQARKEWGEFLQALGRTGPVQAAGEALARLGKAAREAVTPRSAGGALESTRVELAEAEEMLAAMRAGQVPLQSRDRLRQQERIVAELENRLRAAGDRAEAERDIAVGERGEARLAGEDARRNRLLEQARELLLALDPLKKATAEAQEKIALLTRAMAEGGDPTGDLAAGIARLEFQTAGLKDPVEKAIQKLKEEAATAAETGLARAQLEAVLRAEQAARERGLPLAEAERSQVEALAASRYREAKAIEAANQAHEMAVESARRGDEERKEAFERGRRLIESRDALERSYEREVEESGKLLDALRISNKEYEKQKALLEILARYRELGLPLVDPEEIDRARRLAERLGENREQIEKLKEGYKASAAAGRDFAHAISTAFEEAAISGKNLGEVMLSLGRTIEQIILRIAFTKPLESFIEDIFTGFNPFDLLFGAKGLAFEAGEAIPFARGGMVDRPHAFPVGVMGEAGPEAIVPLRRLPSGDLGVQAAGMPMVKVEVIDQRRAGSPPVEVDQFMGAMGPVVRIIARDEVARGLEDFTRRGQLQHALRADYRVHRPPTQRG